LSTVIGSSFLKRRDSRGRISHAPTPSNRSGEPVFPPLRDECGLLLSTKAIRYSWRATTHVPSGGIMIRRTIASLLAVSLFATVGFAEVSTIEDALALIPDALDVAITFDAEGRALLEAAIDVLENELGVTAVFDHTSEDAYMKLEVPLERKAWINKLSQAYYTLGDVFLEESDALKDAFTRGQYWGLKSLRMSNAFVTDEVQHGFIAAVEQETDVATLFWTYGNWARKDDLDPLGAIARNDPPKLVALIERVLEVDHAYMAYGSYRALAAFWGELPPLPLIPFGQNLPRALSYICPVLDEPSYCPDCTDCPVDPNVDEYFENRLIFAESYLMEKSLWSEAQRVLESILADEIGELHTLYNAYCQARAAELLEEVREHL
jgi:hypothetical protein